MKKTGVKQTIIHELPFFLSLPAFVWQCIFLYIPLGFILYVSFLCDVPGKFFGACSITNYLTFIDPIYFKILARSLLLATCNGFICLFFAYPVAYYLALHVTRLKNLLMFFLILPFWINILVQVYAWYFVLEKHGFINDILMRSGLISSPVGLLNNPFAVYLVMFYCYVPFMVVPIYSILEKLNKQLLDVSADLGARPATTFWRITLPLSMPGIKNGFFLVFVPSFGEFVVPALMGGNKNMYVGTLIQHYYLIMRNPYLGGAFTVFSGIILLCAVAFFFWLFGRSISRGRV